MSELNKKEKLCLIQNYGTILEKLYNSHPDLVKYFVGVRNCVNLR